MRRLFLALFFLSLLTFILGLAFFKETYIHQIAMQMGMGFLAIFLIWKKDLRTTLTSIGIPGKLKDNVVFTVAGLFTLFALAFAIGMSSMIFGFNDQAKISEKVNSLPLIVVVGAVLLAPIAEELFFRGFLVNWITDLTKISWIGIIVSGLVFGMLHFGYSSVVEVVGASMIGILLGVVFRSSGSLVPCIAIHMIYNLLSVAMMKLTGS